MKRWRIVLATVAGGALLAALAGGLLLRGGWYDAGAIKQHYQLTYQLLELGLRYSVRHHAREIHAPPLTDAMAQRGAQLYARFCVQCHGAPGVAPEQAALALQPQPGPLLHMARRWQPHELYWLVANGIKMTGMPAWQYRLSEEELWSVVAFLQQLPRLSPAEGKALLAQAARDDHPSPPPPLRPPDADRGRVALTQYACHSCHQIDGVAGPTVEVGPALPRGYAEQRYIAGYLPNSDDNLVRWIRHPDQVKPGTAMPELQVSEQDARDMARWLRR
ncbi:c-type cytochrome [Duganella callida]|uniref:C-type cytochrome n=1 Tax=Duganella callida TaxID=2561932 RepID=A0A4Y9SBM7_9BURK|nr:c-type cytochrome [Duganella callida]TFW19509.1 c-type cytochrome [Duganella callida]